MKISTNAIKYINEHYGSAGDPAPKGLTALVHVIGAQLGAVEEITLFGERFKGVLIVRVMHVADHPNADRLHICKVDDGGQFQNVDRDDNGWVQVVCGAPNVHEGMLAAWIPPGTVVPDSANTEPFVVDSREFRGQLSHGMMASPKELSLSDDHGGILDIDGDIAPGTSFIDAYHLQDDALIDIENKMFTHRPDCFGWLGVARELEGIQHRAYKSPEWYRTDPDFPAVETDPLPLEVHNELPQLVPRFTAIVMDNITVGPSPVWLQVDLARAGLRSINNIVDYTNFYMMLTGQPIHAYDYDKVKAFSGGDHAVLTVRHPKSNEKITLLNGKEITPRAEAMMVAAGDHLACVGGAMGGADTEVDNNTTRIILEAASWDMFSMRKTAMAHGIFTDAVTRFNKGQSPLQNLATLWKIVDQIRRINGGKIASPVVDLQHLPDGAVERGNIYPAVTVTAAFINQRLGFTLSAEDMGTLLSNVEFKVDRSDDTLTVTAPFWRTDIAIAEDIVEEVGRLYGYDHLPLELPMRDVTPAPKNPDVELRLRIRQLLSSAGANELLCYSFVHGNLLDRVGQNRDQAFQIANALSPDLQYFRLSLTPSLLEKVHSNHKAGYDEFAIFEIGKAHVKGLETDGLPIELERVALVFAANSKAASAYEGAPYYQARIYLMRLLQGLGVANEVTFEPLDPQDDDVAATYYDTGRAATIRLGDAVLGRIGEYKASVRQALKLPAFSAGFELGLAPLFSQRVPSGYASLPRFPKVEQDICLKVDAAMPYAQVYNFVLQHLEQTRPDKTRHSLTPVDIYQRDDDLEHKQITLRLSLASYQRTLTDQEVNALLDDVAQAAKTTLQAERI